MPGLVELHTDHLESHLEPRPQVRWPALARSMAYDAQIAAAGITTVFDFAARRRRRRRTRIVGRTSWTARRRHRRRPGAGPAARRASHASALRDLRRTTWSSRPSAYARRGMPVAPDLADGPHAGPAPVRDLETWRTYYGGKSGLPEAELDALHAARRSDLFASNYARAPRSAGGARQEPAAVVTGEPRRRHAEHVAGRRSATASAIAEFPTTVEAAARLAPAGIAVMMGAPNVVRGGSHSGNVAAEELAREGVLDILSSDYVPASLLMAAFELARRIEGYGLPAAIRTVTLHPARATGLTDRGAIAAGLRADLVRIRMAQDLPVVREVYRGGRRVL